MPLLKEVGVENCKKRSDDKLWCEVEIRPALENFESLKMMIKTMLEFPIWK